MFQDIKQNKNSGPSVKLHAQKLFDIGYKIDEGKYFSEVKNLYAGDIPQPVRCATHILYRGFGLPQTGFKEIPHHLRSLGMTDIPDLDEHELTMFLEHFGSMVLTG